MRHLVSIVLGIVLAPIIYVLAGVGEIKFTAGSAVTSASGDTDWNAVGIGIGALVVAGGLYALLVMARISPLGPLIAGLAYVGAEAWMLFDDSSLVKLIGHSTFGVDGAQESPLTGLALLLAVPLLITIVSPRRWRRTATASSDNQSIYPDPTSAAPTYESPSTYETGSTYEPTLTASAPTQTTPETAADNQPTFVDANDETKPDETKDE